MSIFSKNKPRYKYKTVKVSGTFRTGRGWIKKQEKIMNKMAKHGWEYIDSEELGRGKNQRIHMTTYFFHMTRYVIMRFRKPI